MKRIFAVRATAVVGSVLSIMAANASAAEPDNAVERGKYLVTAGDCVACHSKPGGEAFAGGRPIATPFGTIASPNLTPDKETGIGNYTDDQFYEALHNGVNSKGQYLYPVLPYTSYTNVTRDDVLAIKAYLFSLKPVHAPNEGNAFPFPYNIRTSLAVWRELFFKPGEFKPDPTKSAQVNRGAYLVQGLEHCGECHTKRNALGGAVGGKELQGSSVQGWYAPNITSDMNAGIGQWSEDELFSYLKTGSTPRRGIAVGPMAEVVHGSLAKLTDEDVRAITVYLKSTVPAVDASASPPAKLTASFSGDEQYLDRCASCHGTNGRGIPGAIPALAENGSVTAATGDNVIKVVLGGLRATGTYGPMPSFADTLNDEDIARITNYVRVNWGNNATPNATPEQVRSLRKGTQVMLTLGEGLTTCPDDLSEPEKDVQSKATGEVETLLRGATLQNLATTVRTVVPMVKTSAASASNADLVNGLTTGYCKILENDTRFDTAQKRALLSRFGQQAFVLLSSGKLYGPGNSPTISTSQ